MKKQLLTIGLFALTGLLQQPALAQDPAGVTMSHEMPASVTTTTRTPAEALTALQEGVTLMGETVSEKNIAEMFAQGPIMDKWHEKTMEMTESIDLLKAHAAMLPDDKKTRLESALNQFSKTLDDFHMMTHEQDPVKSGKEVKKAEGALKLVEAALK